MKIKTFIDRPLLSIVINVMIVSLGVIALGRLPIEKYPDIAPPTVYLGASYPGASAEAIKKSVLAPLEQAINGVDNMTLYDILCKQRLSVNQHLFQAGYKPGYGSCKCAEPCSTGTGHASCRSSAIRCECGEAAARAVAYSCAGKSGRYL